jgi:hypothetical protein
MDRLTEREIIQNLENAITRLGYEFQGDEPFYFYKEILWDAGNHTKIEEKMPKLTPVVIEIVHLYGGIEIAK